MASAHGSGRELRRLSVGNLSSKAFKIIRETVATEERYLSSLRKCVNSFLEPLRAHRKVPRADVETLFGGIEHLVPLNESLLADLREAEVDDTISLGDVFLRWAAFLKLYQSYISGHNAATAKLAELYAHRKIGPIIRKLETAAMESLQSLLIMPVQRLPRYQLLLKELLKAHPKGHDDYDSIARALVEVEKCLNDVNEKLEMEANAADMVKAQTELGMTDLVAPNRCFVRSGRLADLTPILHGTSRSRSVKVFLFNDLLAVQPVEGLDAPVEVVPLAGATITYTPPTPGEAGSRRRSSSTGGVDRPNTFKLVTSDSVHVFQGMTADVAVSWAEDVARCLMVLCGLTLEAGRLQQLLQARKSKPLDNPTEGLPSGWRIVGVTRSTNCYWNYLSGEMSRMHPHAYDLGGLGKSIFRAATGGGAPVVAAVAAAASAGARRPAVAGAGGDRVAAASARPQASVADLGGDVEYVEDDLDDSASGHSDDSDHLNLRVAHARGGGSADKASAAAAAAAAAGAAMAGAEADRGLKPTDSLAAFMVRRVPSEGEAFHVPLAAALPTSHERSMSTQAAARAAASRRKRRATQSLNIASGPTGSTRGGGGDMAEHASGDTTSRLSRMARVQAAMRAPAPPGGGGAASSTLSSSSRHAPAVPTRSADPPPPPPGAFARTSRPVSKRLTREGQTRHFRIDE